MITRLKNFNINKNSKAAIMQFQKDRWNYEETYLQRYCTYIYIWQATRIHSEIKVQISLQQQENYNVHDITQQQ